MIEDMTIRKLSPKTQQGYIRTIKNLAIFLGRSPDTASFEDAGFGQAPAKCRHDAGERRGRRAAQESDHRH
jgi:hypothetical protein